MRSSLAPEERRRLARKRQEEEVFVDARLELAAMLGNQALARALARQPATLEPPAPEQSEPLKPGIPPWIQALYVTAGVLTPDEANAMLNQVGAWGLQRFMVCVPLERDPIEARRVHITVQQPARGILDWDKTHSQLSPGRPEDGQADEARLRHAARDLLPAPRERADEDLRRPVAGPRADRGRGRRVRGQHDRGREDPRPAVPRPPVRDRRDAQRHRVRALPAGRGQDVLQHLRLRRRHRDGRLPAARLVDGRDVGRRSRAAPRSSASPTSSA